MKKLLVSVLSLTMVFSAAITVSAAPTVSGEVNYILNDDHAAGLEGKINLDGKLNNNTDYKVTLKKDDNLTNPYSMNDPVFVDEASLTYKNHLGQIQVGQFAYNPTVMDMMDTVNFSEMKAPFAIKVTPDLGENIHVALGYQPFAEASTGFDEGAFQAEADYKISMVNLGVNYQDINGNGQDTGLVWQVEVQPAESFKVFGEYGNKAGTDDKQGLVGAQLTEGKFGVRGEYNMDTEDWAAKVSYNVTDNISTEFKTTNSDINGSYNEVKLKYTF